MTTMTSTSTAKPMTMARRVVTLVICIAVPLAVGFFSSMLSGDIRASYEAMQMPPLSPPGWLFGIVWPILYVLMGIAIFLVFLSAGDMRRKRASVVLFIVQLALNFAWSPVFFAGGLLWVALAVIVAMDVLMVVTIGVFWGINRAAAFLMLPYFVWIFFATYLNMAFAMLNA